jgi:hypothetical protein
MPRKLRNAKGRLDRLTDGETLHLLTGHDFFGDGFGQGEDLDQDAMRQAWAVHHDQVVDRAHRDRQRAHWPIYAELRFDQGLSREEALEARRLAHTTPARA